MTDNRTRIAAVASSGRRPSDSNGLFKLATLEGSNGASAPLIDPRRVDTADSYVHARIGFLHGAPAFVMVHAVYLAMCLTRPAGLTVLAIGRKSGIR